MNSFSYTMRKKYIEIVTEKSLIEEIFTGHRLLEKENSVIMYFNYEVIYSCD